MRRFLAVIDAGLLSVTFLYGERHNVWPDHGGILRPAWRKCLFNGGDRRTDESSSAVPSRGAHRAGQPSESGFSGSGGMALGIGLPALALNVWMPLLDRIFVGAGFALFSGALVAASLPKEYVGQGMELCGAFLPELLPVALTVLFLWFFFAVGRLHLLQTSHELVFELCVPVLAVLRDPDFHLIPGLPIPSPHLLCRRNPRFAVIRQKLDGFQVRMVFEISVQGAAVQPAEGDGVAADLRAEGTEAHEVDRSLENRRLLDFRAAGQAEANLLVAAENIPLEAGAYLGPCENPAKRFLWGKEEGMGRVESPPQAETE